VVTKGMAVTGTSTGLVVDTPRRGGLVNQAAVMITLVAIASVRTMMMMMMMMVQWDNRLQVFLLLDETDRVGQLLRWSERDDLSTLCAWVDGLVSGGHGGVEGGEVAHHALVLFLLVGMNGLSMLTKIIESGELFVTMAAEGTFAGMFTNVPGKMFASAKDHTTFAVASTLKSFSRGRAVTLVNARIVDDGR
jgi:hypothetical protein